MHANKLDKHQRKANFEDTVEPVRKILRVRGMRSQDDANADRRRTHVKRPSRAAISGGDPREIAGQGEALR